MDKLNNPVFLLAALLIILLLVSLAAWLRIYGVKQIRRSVRETGFLFRWFIIGKYHCNITPQQKSFLKFLNKILWGGVVIGWAILLAELVAH